ncbi:MAG TPA: tetratricopeptide repeat protein [Myxococcota bacterium]|nr:tetratricopeptide repeat protein [Myxococcota bacterium]
MIHAHLCRALLALLTALLLSGCVSKKGALRPGAPASEENKEQALKLFREGSEMLFQQNEEALSKFNASSKLDPDLIAAYYNAGIANEALGRKEDAIKDYELCLEHNKEQGDCLNNLVILLHDSGENDKANDMVSKYLSEYPELPFAMVAAAKLALVNGDLKTAEQYARQAIERDAENVEALYVMARIFYKEKRYPAARFTAKNALELAPSHGQLHLLLGRTYEALGQVHDALDSYAMAAKYYPSEEALETYGLMLLRRGRVQEALAPLKRVSELRPKDYRHFLHLGNAYMANKMFIEAKAAYDKALELNPADKDINYNLGLLFYDFQPSDMSEIDRLKLSQSYFKAYLEQPGLEKERIHEVNDYIKKLGNKIEALELAAQPAPEETEQPPETKEEVPEEGEVPNVP